MNNSLFIQIKVTRALHRPNGRIGIFARLGFLQKLKLPCTYGDAPIVLPLGRTTGFWSICPLRNFEKVLNFPKLSLKNSSDFRLFSKKALSLKF